MHYPPPTGECLKALPVPHWGMPQCITRPPLGNASRHYPSPTGECLNALPAPPHWGMPQGITRPPLGNASRHYPAIARPYKLKGVSFVSTVFLQCTSVKYCIDSNISAKFQVIRGFSQKIPADLLSYDKIHS